MADDDKWKFDIPWATVLSLIAVLGGIVAQYKPLVSTRPPVPSEKAIPLTAKQDVEARLWQDPISVAEKQKSLLDERIEKGLVKGDDIKSHDISTLAKLLRERVNIFHENVLLLAVMLDAGPYSEQAESRLRARQAVLEGLSESGFAPVDGEHIGFVTADWPPQTDNVPPPWLPGCPSSPPVEGAVLLPWEANSRPSGVNTGGDSAGPCSVRRWRTPRPPRSPTRAPRPAPGAGPCRPAGRAGGRA